MTKTKPDPINEHYLLPTLIFCMGIQIIASVFYGYYLITGFTDAFYFTNGYEFGNLSIIAYRGVRFFSEESFVSITQMILILILISIALDIFAVFLKKRSGYILAILQSIVVLLMVTF